MTDRQRSTEWSSLWTRLYHETGAAAMRAQLEWDAKLLFWYQFDRPEGLPWQYGPSPGVPCKEGIPIAIQFGLSTPPPIVPPRPSGGPGAMASSQPMSPSLGHQCSSGAVPQSQPTLPVRPARALSRPLPPPAEITSPPPPPYQLFGADGASNRIPPMLSTAERLDIATQNILRSGDNTPSGPSTPPREDTAAQYILR